MRRGNSANRGILGAAVLSSGAILTPLASADDPPPALDPVRTVVVEADGWKFTPALQCGEIKGFFAQILPELSYPGNLDVLWFEPTATGSWSAWGWNGSSGAETNAIGWIRSRLGDDSVFSENPRLQSPAPSEPATWTAPAHLMRGLLEDHPLQLVLGDEPRSSDLFATLEQAGWGVAPVISRLSERDHGASTGVNLQELLRALVGKTLVLVPGTVAQTGTGPTAGGPTFPWDCECTLSYGTPVYGPWVFLYSVPAMGGGLTCHYERTVTTPWRTIGDYFLSCIGCTDSGSEITTQPGRTTVTGPPCVPPP